jgi:hypothetical protein
MRIGLYSIPATGTRFVASALSHIGADFSRRHVGYMPPVPEWRRVLPVRDPYECYLSHMHHGYSKTDSEFVSKWASYLWRTQWMDAFYFPIDTIPHNRQVVIQSLMTFCGKSFDGDVIDSFVWKNEHASDRDRELEVPEHVKHQLAFAKEWHKHYTLFWGAKHRHAENMLGEGK